jgi:tRNA A37 methylthiotransferase MiaB
MPDQISPPLKAERVQRLMELERTLRERYCRLLIGRSSQVLVESPAAAADRMIGTGARYETVELTVTPEHAGQFFTTTPRELAGDRLLA